MKSKIILWILALAALLASVTASAQDRLTVRGVVKDNQGVPLTGVSVMILGTQTGVSTGFDGDYEISVRKGATLLFSFLGFEDVEVTVTSAKCDVIMNEAAETLDQVVVTGYSQIELRKSTGAVGVVSEESLKDSPLKNMDQLLQGKLAGVSVQASSGRPGAAAKVRIRGTNTITGNAEPLWVIDGVPMQKNIPTMNSSQIKSGDFDNIFATGIGNINPNDIESITVLKDASAAAIYGSQAANGVIVVTTKRGQAGSTSVSYSGTVSVNTKPSRSPNLMNSKEKLAWEQELWDEFSKAGYEAGGTSYYPRVGIVGQIRSGYGNYKGLSTAEQDALIEELGSQTTDWFDVLFRNTVSTSHYLSLSGGAPNLTYYVSGGYSYNNGIVVNTNSSAANFTAKVDTRPAKWMKLNFQADFSYQKALSPSSSVDMFRYAYFANPYEQPYNEDGSYKADMTYFTLASANGSVDQTTPPNGFNLMREINETQSKSTSASATIQGNTTIDIYKGFNFTGLASFSYMNDLSSNINGKNTQAAWDDRPFETDFFSKRAYGSITQQATQNISYLLRGQFNFAKSIREKHNINSIVGAEIRSSYAQSIYTKRYGYDPVTGNHSTPLPPTGTSGTVDYNKLTSYQKILDACYGQSITENAFASFYGTATYNYDSKYIVSGTLRSDGSNNFGSDEQFNLNWSVSGAWVMDREPWMQSISHILSSFGIRGGFGYTGGVNPNVYPILIMTYDSTFRTTDDDSYRKGTIKSAPNPHLSWEKNQTTNVGMNFGFLHDRITGEISYYHNKNLDLVTSVVIPSTTGFDSQKFNTSEQINQGVELTLAATPVKIRDFTWRIMANAAFNRNVLTKYDPPVKSLDDNAVGYPTGKIFTGVSLGIDPETGFYKFQQRPDVDISSMEDYRTVDPYLFYVGTSNAPWNGGFSTTFTYKNISLNIVGNFSIGGKVLNNITSPVSYSTLDGTTTQDIQNQRQDLYVNHLNVVKDVTYRWTEDNPVTDGYPRLMDAYGSALTDKNGVLLNLTNNFNNTITRSVLLEDVSYLKLSSVSLSYTFPKRWTDAMKIGGMSASFLASNLFFITNYSGIDPEVPGATYPQSRSFTFSLAINF